MLRAPLTILVLVLALPAQAQAPSPRAAASAPPAQPQTQGPLPRVKGRIVDFDGLTFHLAPEQGPQLAVRLQAHTQFMTTARLAPSALKVGAYVGATVTDSEGALTAEEVHVYPDAMKGSSEGRIALGGARSVVTGAITSVAHGSMAVFYRGGRAEGGVCLDRADPAVLSPVCTGHPTIQLPAGTSITALAPTDRRLLVPGAIATVTIETDAKGVRSTPGLILEKP